jgi:CRP-like cAMP-binding protein
MQSTACAGLHSIEQRCCRWLLTTRDRVDSDPFSLSHEFLALMLGTRRATVSQVMKKLQDRGLIKYQRGRITIADRAGLVTSSCECYQVVADAYRRVMRVARQS